MNFLGNTWQWLFKLLGLREEDCSAPHHTAIVLVEVFYLLAFVLVGMSVSSYGLSAKWSDLLSQEANFAPLWAIRWMKWGVLSYETSIGLIIAFAVISTGLAAGFWRKHQAFRILAFLGILQYTSLSYSYGNIYHSYQALVVTAGIFALIPRSSFNPAISFTYQKELFAAIIGAQLFIMLGYSCSGGLKWLAIFEQWWVGVPHALSSNGLSYQISTSMISQRSPPVLGMTIRNATGLVPTSLLVFGYCVELLSAPIYLFRPNYHRLYGILIIGLHILAAGIIGPEFSQHSLIVGCLLVFSPFTTRTKTEISV